MNIKKSFLPLILPIFPLIFIAYWTSTTTIATASERGKWEKPHLLSEVDVISAQEFQSRPNIAFDKNGNAIAIWMLPEGEQFYIWYARYVKEKGWGKAEIIEKNIGGESKVINTPRSIRLVVDSKGNALIVWLQPIGANKASIWTKQYNVSKGWRPTEPIEINLKGNIKMDVVSDEKGNAILVWSQTAKNQDEQDGQNGNDVWIKRYEAGKGWADSELIETNLQGLSDFQIVMDKDGNAMLVFNQEYEGIYAKRYEAGKGWGKSQIISEQPFFSTRVTVAPNNDIFFLGHQHYNGRGVIGTSRYKVGKGWEPLQIIHEYYSKSSDHSAIDDDIIVDINGNALAVWSWSDYYGRGINYDIWWATYEEGKGWNAPKIISTDKGGRVFLNIIYTSNTAIIVWSLKKDGGVSSSLLATVYEVGKGWGKPQIIDTDIKNFASENGIVVYIKRNGIWASRFVNEN